VRPFGCDVPSLSNKENCACIVLADFSEGSDSSEKENIKQKVDDKCRSAFRVDR
jgi:hypothetical protein